MLAGRRWKQVSPATADVDQSHRSRALALEDANDHREDRISAVALRAARGLFASPELVFVR